MRLRYMLTALLALAGLTSQAHAGASAKKEYVCSGGYVSPYGECGGDQAPIGERVTVYIQANGADAGRPGSYFIGARRNGQDIVMYTASGQWLGWQGGLYEPAGVDAAITTNTRSFVVLDKQFVCSLAGAGQVELWAGYGVLDKQSEFLVANYHAEANPRIPADHIRKVYTQNDMTKNGKFWNVLNVSCGDMGGGGG